MSPPLALKKRRRFFLYMKRLLPACQRIENRRLRRCLYIYRHHSFLPVIVSIVKSTDVPEGRLTVPFTVPFVIMRSVVSVLSVSEVSFKDPHIIPMPEAFLPLSFHYFTDAVTEQLELNLTSLTFPASTPQRNSAGLKAYGLYCIIRQSRVRNKSGIVKCKARHGSFVYADHRKINCLVSVNAVIRSDCCAGIIDRRMMPEYQILVGLPAPSIVQLPSRGCYGRKLSGRNRYLIGFTDLRYHRITRCCSS